MRLTQKKTEQILIGILGQQGVPLIEELMGKENVSEFDLAIRTKLDIKVVRKLLYILYNHNLVCFNRKKDKQKGWYIYYWTLVPESIKFSYFKSRKSMLERLRGRLEEEEKELFFVSPDKMTRMNFDDAMEYDFRCPDTGDLLMQDDNADLIKQLKIKIKTHEKEMDMLIASRHARRKNVRIKKKEIGEKKALKKKVAKEAVAKKSIKKKVAKKPTTGEKTAAKKKVVERKKEVKKKVASKRKSTTTKKKVVERKKEVKKKTVVKKKVTKEKNSKLTDKKVINKKK